MRQAKKHARLLCMICMVAIMFCIVPAGRAVHAAEDGYEPLTVAIPFKHVYTTTDLEADSLFHYLVTPKDGAPLPAETDSEGSFPFDGIDGEGEETENGTLFVLDGKLTFTFSMPGVYEYVLTADFDADADKKADENYTLEPREFKITCYIVNDPENGMKLTMLTSEEDGVKTVDIELDPAYEAPEEEKPEPDDKTPGTGDESKSVMYAVMMASSLTALIVIAAIQTKKKGRA